MTTFIAVYRGRTISEARLVAVSVDPVIVAQVSSRLLDVKPDGVLDPVASSLERGRRAALRLINQETGRRKKQARP